jgi:uncharacterized protein (DUF1501 family)
MDRRGFLKGLGTAACSAAAHPWLTSVSLAEGAGFGENRLVVVILRGAMDGLDVVQPRGDAAYAALRPGLSGAPALELDGFFHLHSGLSGLMPLWQAGALGFVHATSTPYRDKRSHFDGQDLLEAGTDVLGRDGWLNRLMQVVPGARAETAYAVGREGMLILTGKADTRSWAPEQKLVLSAQGRLLLDHVAHDDDLFRDVVSEALALTEGQGAGNTAGDEVDGLVDFAAARLREETRVATFSLTGWDTHKGQTKAMRRPLERLQRVILRLQSELGDQVWGRTVVLAMTEFGRTAAENGSGGTDHGTGGVMLAAGGALRGGRVYGDWPGLAEAALYQRRDLMPTSDLRAWAAHAMRGLYGVDRAALENTVFPGLLLPDDPGFLL